MLICLCRGITDRDVHELVARGITDLAEIKRRTGAGTECRLCLADVERAHREALRAQARDRDQGATPQGSSEG